MIIITTGLINLYAVHKVSETQHIIAGYRVNTVNAEKEVKNGINQSLAALRGYMILGNDPQKAQQMKDQRQQAWLSINKALNQLKAGVTHLSAANLKQIENLENLLVEFKQAQQRVEDIAQATDNIPSYQLLLNEAVPTGDALLQSITYIINIESGLAATAERKSLLKLLADSRGSLATGLASIRAYLLSGNDDFKDQFSTKWIVNTQRFNTINNNYLDLFSIEQRQHWNEYIKAREHFESLPLKCLHYAVAKTGIKLTSY